MQPCKLSQVIEATNVYLMILDACFISENVLKLPFCKIGLHVYTSLRTCVTFFG